MGDPGTIPGLGRSPGEGNGNPLQYSCLENPMDGGAWWATVHGVAKSGTQLSDFTFTFYLYLSYSEHMDTQRLSGFLCQLPQLFSYIALPTFFFFSPIPTSTLPQTVTFISYMVCEVSFFGFPFPIPGEGNGNPLQYSCLVNPMDRGALWATVSP